MQGRPLIIVNPIAAKASRIWPLIRARFEEGALKFDVLETTRPGEATTATRTALRNGTKTIAVVGGDGTLSEAAEGFFEIPSDLERLPVPINPEAALAILPAGTGDDFGRGLQGSRLPLVWWLDTLIAHLQNSDGTRTQVVDVLYGTCGGNAHSFICLNASTMGIGGETAARVAAQQRFMRSLSGEVRFMAAAVGALAAWRERRVRVSVDDNTVIDSSMNLVAVANGLYAGGGMMLSPQARLDDGKLDVITASGLTRAAVVRELPRLHSGGHVANPKVQITQGRRVLVETFSAEDGLLIEADGNVRGTTPAEFRVLPGALKVVV